MLLRTHANMGKHLTNIYTHKFGSQICYACQTEVCATFGGDPVKSRGDGDFGVQNLRPSLYYPIAAGAAVAAGLPFAKLEVYRLRDDFFQLCGES